jgi:2-polyprenyl-6-methoxyphenol hydroxylase-like FAD-dependent oxidoreductase
VGAEGRNSPTREAARIPIAKWSYDHAAMVTTILHEHPHDNVAYEIFYPAGPFAMYNERAYKRSFAQMHRFFDEVFAAK